MLAIPCSRQRLLATVAAAAGIFHASLVSAAPGEREPDLIECGSLQNHYGPFDYRTATAAELARVERRHFTGQIEGLVKGESGSLGGDIGYTLRVYPNHVRALNSMVRLAIREKVDTPRGAIHSVECYLKRGEVFQPDDWHVKSAYGVFLLRVGRVAEAIERMEQAETMNPGNANLLYNLGLAYAKAGKYPEALEKAHAAYRMGFPLPGLREKLKRAGHWREPGDSK